MKKIILLAVMSLALLYLGLINFSFAEDLAKGISEFTGEEMAEENAPIILAQRNIEQNEDDLDEKDKEDDRIKGPKEGVKWVEEVEIEEGADDDGAGQVPSRRERRREDKTGRNKN